MVDVAASAKFSSVTTNKFPCLSATRGGSKRSFFSTWKKGCTTYDDYVRLTGLPLQFYDRKSACISDNQFGRMLGNAAPVNLWMRLLPRVLFAAGVIDRRPEVDFWKRLVKCCKKARMSTKR